jgi:hypothetical protein
MASTFQIERSVASGKVVASVYVSSKDPVDDLAARTFGDIKVRRSGIFLDTHDGTFPPFQVNCGPDIGVLLNTLPEYKITNIFDDETLPIEVRMRQASVWTAALLGQITAALDTLRDKIDTTGGNQTVTI